MSTGSSSLPDLSTLPQRMRYAAAVLREVDVRYNSLTGAVPHENIWCAETLEAHADRWEAQEQQHEELIDELAKDLSNYTGGWSHREAARSLINNAGWTKAERS